MPSDPLVLAFDTSAAHCAAALLSGGRLIDQRLEPMRRGQAERLMVLLQEVLTDNGASWRDLGALGVGVGPGNFTGIRISVAAARGLALGLNIPAVGVTGCEARRALRPDALCAIPGPRDQLFLCDPSLPVGSVPDLVPMAAASDKADSLGRPLWSEASPRDLAAAIGQVATLRWQDDPPAPAPLYARAPDAAPSRDRPPVILD